MKLCVGARCKNKASLQVKLTSYMPLRIVSINKVLSLSEVTVTKDPGTTGEPFVLCRSTLDPKLEFCPRPFGFWLQSGPAGSF